MVSDFCLPFVFFLQEQKVTQDKLHIEKKKTKFIFYLLRKSHSLFELSQCTELYMESKVTF